MWDTGFSLVPGSPGAGFLPGAGFRPGAGFQVACVRTKGGLTLHILTSSKQPGGGGMVAPHTTNPVGIFRLGVVDCPRMWLFYSIILHNFAIFYDFDTVSIYRDCIAS